ncbi:MAG TPA: PQQ-binding-like beta-propeller repeat protein [Pseudoduganella sp.]|jgi:hypothetical protein
MKVFGSVSTVLAAAACALALTACGGDGGDSASASTPVTPATPTPVTPVTPPPAPKPDQFWLTITPSSVDITAYVDEAAKVSITAKSGKTFTKPVNVAIVDKSGVFSTDVKITALSELEYRADLQTSAALPVGQRTVDLELRLCEDDPKVCSVPVAGSPWLIPVKVNVLAATNLTPLGVLSNVANWSTYQGNASHSAYVPAAFDPGKFSRRWALPALTDGDLATSPAHDNGRLFASLTDSRDATSDGGLLKAVLVAYSEESGKELWRADFGPSSHMNPPAAANGKVYVVAKDCCDTFFWVFDQATGKLLSKTNMRSPLWPNRAPTIFGDEVYANSNFSDGALIKFSATTLEQVWQSSVREFRYWTPAVDDSHAYASIGGSLYAVETGNGKHAFTITDPEPISDSGYIVGVALSGDGMAYTVHAGDLRAFDLPGRKLAWKVGGTAIGAPALARSAVYVLNKHETGQNEGGAVLEARDAATGALQWTSDLLPKGSYWLVATQNLAFVSSDDRTVAIDLATHRIVWDHPAGGELSISNRGVLYIGGEGGKITAINLR